MEVTYAADSENQGQGGAGGLPCDVSNGAGRVCVRGCGKGFFTESHQAARSVVLFRNHRVLHHGQPLSSVGEDAPRSGLHG